MTVRGVGRGSWLSCRALPLALVFPGSLVTLGLRVFPVEKKGVHCRAGAALLEGHGRQGRPLPVLLGWSLRSPSPGLKAKAPREGIDATAETKLVGGKGRMEEFAVGRLPGPV